MQSESSTQFPEELLAHQDWVVVLARQLVADEFLADDIVQETWLAALKNPPRVESARPWFRRVLKTQLARARRTSIAHRDRERRFVDRTDAEQVQPGADAAFERARMLQQVVELTLKLKEPYRSVLLIRYVEELQPREIALRLGMPLNTVLSNLQRGLGKLREALEREHGDRHAWCGALMVLVLSPAELRALGLAKGSALIGGVTPLAVFLALCSLVVAVCVRGTRVETHEDLLALVPDPSVERHGDLASEPSFPALRPEESSVAKLTPQPVAAAPEAITLFAARADLAAPALRFDTPAATSSETTGAIRTDDVIITSSGLSHEFVLHAAQDGTHRTMTTAGAGGYWVGNALLPGGGWACVAVAGSKALAPEVSLFEAGTGRRAHSFAIPEVGFPGDIDVFSDGVLAVSDRCGPLVQLYTQDGAHLETIEFAGESAWGIHVDPAEGLWVGDPLGRCVHRFDRRGRRLSSTPVRHIMGDLASSGDGTFWTVLQLIGVVQHFRVDGTITESFDPGFGRFAVGVALASDGNLWVSGTHSREVRRFSPEGLRLGEILCPARFQPEFLSVAASVPAGTAFCFGDGHGVACPCGNRGAPGHGCANSRSLDGGVLGVTGSASIAAANLSFEGRGLIPGQPGVYFQGGGVVGETHGLTFGDGLRCAGGEVTRLEIVTADEGGSSRTSTNVATRGEVSAGQTRQYQLWYRDPTGSPCGNGFNLTNGIEIVWCP